MTGIFSIGQRVDTFALQQNAVEPFRYVGRQAKQAFKALGEKVVTQKLHNKFESAKRVVLQNYTIFDLQNPSKRREMSDHTFKRLLLEEAQGGVFFKQLDRVHNKGYTNPVTGERINYAETIEHTRENGTLEYLPAQEKYLVSASTDLAKAVLSTPKTLKAMKKYGVTLEEAMAISLYTSQGYKVINGEVRSGEFRCSVEILTKLFAKGISKLPDFEGPVYRGAELPARVGITYQEGHVIQDQGIVSFTSAQDQAFKAINYSIKMQAKAGDGLKDISDFSDKPEEKEVVCAPGTSFKILERKIDFNVETEVDFNVKHPLYGAELTSGKEAVCKKYALQEDQVFGAQAMVFVKMEVTQPPVATVAA